MKNKKIRLLLPWIIILGVIILIVGGICLKVYLFDGYLSRQKLVYSDGKYYDPKNDITYVSAPYYYEPVSIASDSVDPDNMIPYSRGNGDPLFRVAYRDEDYKAFLVKSSLWLSTDSDHGHTLYYNEKDAVCPSPDEFDAEYIYLVSLSAAELPTQKIDLAASKRIIKEFFRKTEADNLYDSAEFENTTCIKGMKVTSSTYKWLYLNLYLYQGNGKYYIFFPAEKMFCETDKDVFDVYFAVVDSDE
ncbi:MAG: hypothetical protein J5850_01355 [Clostridia bacterium]|nr:hypothetical protein [Clostridia bacterium]